jgi:hypothetical protein
VDGLAREAAHKIGGAIGPSRKLYHVSATQMAFLSDADVEEASYLLLLRQKLKTIRSEWSRGS